MIVYVLTPSLNKSFKFQSDWPYNNSQIYLLQPIMTDISNDKERVFEKTEDGYVITSKVDYSTEKDFKNQKIYVDKEKNITKVEVLDASGNIKMSLTVIDIDYKAKFDDDYFSASKYQSEVKENTGSDNTQNSQTSVEENKSDNSDENRSNLESNNSNSNSSSTDTTTSKIEDIVYPMYVPVDTYLSGQDVVETSNGERVILTFSGESSFTVVQETLANANSTNYIYGDPYLILDTVGAITDYSVSWISNGIEYSIMSDTMSVDELLTVAQSISVTAVAK